MSTPDASGVTKYYGSHYNQWCCLHWMLRSATNLRQKTAAVFYLWRADTNFKWFSMVALSHPVGMCISITEADAIRISMHSQWYDTLKMHTKQLAMRCDMIHLYYDAVRFDFDFDSIQFNTMRFDAIRCNGKNMIAFISLVQTDSNSWINLCLLTYNASRPVS